MGPRSVDQGSVRRAGSPKDDRKLIDDEMKKTTTENMNKSKKKS